MPKVVRAQLDYYAVLEISRTADAPEINAAFRRLAWRYHPDRNPAPGATLQFQDINEAHQVLIDPVRRAEYDAIWHPRVDQHRSAQPMAHRQHRRWRRSHHLRSGLMAVAALVFVSSAWAAIFTAMKVAHSASPLSMETVATSIMGSGESVSCGYSMEMFPVYYRDQHGRVQTTWETEVHNCYGGGVRFSATPLMRQAFDSRFANDPEAH